MSINLRPMPIHADDLLLFAEVADCGGFSRAGAKLGIPKATVSRRMAQLEMALGERLMQRTTRQLSLTELGEHLRQHAEQIQLALSAVHSLKSRRELSPSGVLKVSLPPDIADWLAESLSAFVAKHPAIRLELDVSPRLVDVIGEGVDLAIRFSARPSDGSMAAKRIGEMPWGIFASSEFIIDNGMPTSPADLLQLPSLRLKQLQSDLKPWRLNRLVGKDNPNERWEGSPPIRATANSPAVLLRMAQEGLGVVNAPIVLANMNNHLIRLLPDWDGESAIAWAVFPSNRLIPAKTQAFLNLFEQALGKQ
jgi:DNA-binding transcriptional LysR family regulator